MAGARLTDGNANIADLSDENRPTKLAEQYSELYDNEWTDAFEVLTAGEHVSEQDACHTLLEALCAFYNACKKKANGDLENMREAIKTFLGGKEPPSELMKPLKDQRKKIHNGHLKHLKRDLKENIHKLFPDKKKRHDVRLKLFLNKGIELCWLMVIQDPSVYLDVTICNRYGEKYESTTLKPYTQSGQYIDYIVWPPLYLNEGGNILCKGIAQCKSGVTNRISCNARPPTSEQQEITRATKTETELQESIKETKNSETKLEGATLSVSDSYHNDRYTDPGTCSNQKESNHAKPISVGILSVTENENRSELPVLDEMLTTNEVNKHDAKTNITTVTETDGQEKMGAIDNSEFPSEVNLTDSKANFSKLH
ncbi:uncharacterized protein LOC128554717 [Mercenaria mercenaria]|uniref:uncharacterized protein LOC128554717 n=1 Tax=Mercenaria mercenaria TaxID=6596 RepID=UPI00234EC8B4|nr:uncharacterized protein LOC128554717 [Mercenaria mercenaria]